MRIEFEMTEDIGVEGTTLFVLTEPGVATARRANQRALVLLAIAAASVLVVMRLTDGTSDGVTVGGYALLFAMTWLLWPTQAKTRQAVIDGLKARVATDPAYGRAVGWRVFELRPGGFHVDSDYLRAELPWNAVVRTIRTPDWFLMVFVGPSPVPIARESFPTDREFDEFADEAERLIRAGGGTVGASPE